MYRIPHLGKVTCAGLLVSGLLLLPVADVSAGKRVHHATTAKPAPRPPQNQASRPAPRTIRPVPNALPGPLAGRPYYVQPYGSPGYVVQPYYVPLYVAPQTGGGRVVNGSPFPALSGMGPPGIAGQEGYILRYYSNLLANASWLRSYYGLANGAISGYGASSIYNGFSD